MAKKREKIINFYEDDTGRSELIGRLPKAILLATELEGLGLKFSCIENIMNEAWIEFKSEINDVAVKEHSKTIIPELIRLQKSIRTTIRLMTKINEIKYGKNTQMDFFDDLEFRTLIMLGVKACFLRDGLIKINCKTKGSLKKRHSRVTLYGSEIAHMKTMSNTVRKLFKVIFPCYLSKADNVVFKKHGFQAFSAGEIKGAKKRTYNNILVLLNNWLPVSPDYTLTQIEDYCRNIS